MSPHPHLPRPGPILYARDISRQAVRLGVISVTAENADPPRIDVPGGEPAEVELYYSRFGAAVWGAEIVIPAGPDSCYRVDGTSYPVLTELDGDCRLAFVSCNGHEKGDDGWSVEQRNVMWSRLAAEHGASPLGLLLQGGDQIYADGIKTCHPQIKRWSRARRSRRDEFDMTEEMADTAERYLFHRYLALWDMPQIAALVAEVPSFMIWDDHDIFDGWGSHPAAVQDGPVGRALFRIARKMFRLFQLGLPAEGRPDPAGFTRALRMPGFSVIAPDLRSTRTRKRIMGEETWAAFEAALDGLPDGEPLFFVSSVPALGPRLSWFEMLMDLIPGAQTYEDDLRDQWQSRAHREEWRRLLRLMEHQITERHRPVTILSGEIHLATRAEMRLPDGGVLHQLVASGIAHPPPPAAWARALGLLATLGGAPLSGRPISLHPLPGRRWIYTRERNYLLLIREAGHWCAIWETEDLGPTDALTLPAA